MNFRLLAKVLGLLLTLESVAMAACGVFAKYDSEGAAAVGPRALLRRVLDKAASMGLEDDGNLARRRQPPVASGRRAGITAHCGRLR